MWNPLPGILDGHMQQRTEVSWHDVCLAAQRQIALSFTALGCCPLTTILQLLQACNTPRARSWLTIEVQLSK